MSDTEKCAHAPIPQDLQGLYRVVTAYVVSGEGAPISPSFAKKLIERIAKLESARDQLRIERDAAREALIRLRDCDWVISLPDRMDAVREIARAALATPLGTPWSTK